MLKHWIWLTTRKGIGIVGRAQLLRLFGSAERIYALTERDCLDTEGFEKRWLEGVLDKSLDLPLKILKDCDERDISVLTYADRAYPERLRNIADPPAVLYYRGQLPKIDHEAVIGIVGTRACSAYGLLHAKQFARLIAASGGIIVSGGARGIDTMALRGALDSAVPVVCVLGCGIDVPYPPENRNLFCDIMQHGCIISEYPPGTRPDRGNFPVRNRIISGLSLGVLVIEAPERSGALITAQLALEQGRDVFAVPGNLGVKNNEGTNLLLREGAIMATDGWDVISVYSHRYPDKLVDGRTKEAHARIYRARFGSALPVYSPIPETNDKLSIDEPPVSVYSGEKREDFSQEEQTVFRCIASTPVHIDRIIEECGLTTSQTTAVLTMLLIRGSIKKLDANYYQRI